MFPVSLKGAVFSELETVEATLARAEEALREQRAKTVDREGEAGLRFSGSFMNRRMGGSVLKVISRGTIQVRRAESGLQASYHLYFGQSILVRGAVAIAAFGFIYYGIPSGNSARTIAGGLAFWVLLMAMDYWLAAWLFPRFLAQALQKDSG